eukprot:5742876-Pyramimonas_sp.AAC.1
MAPKWASSGGRLSLASPSASQSARPSAAAGHCRAKCGAAQLGTLRGTAATRPTGAPPRSAVPRAKGSPPARSWPSSSA